MAWFVAAIMNSNGSDVKTLDEILPPGLRETDMKDDINKIKEEVEYTQNLLKNAKIAKPIANKVVK